MWKFECTTSVFSKVICHIYWLKQSYQAAASHQHNLFLVFQGAPVAEWLASLTPNQQAVTNVGSKPICVRYWEPALIWKGHKATTCLGLSLSFKILNQIQCNVWFSLSSLDKQNFLFPFMTFIILHSFITQLWILHYFLHY